MFVGTLYVGAPHSQPVKVIFDTGSEHLAITSALCNNKSAGNFHVSKEDKFSKFLKLDYSESNKTFADQVKEFEQSELIDTDDESDDPETYSNLQESESENMQSSESNDDEEASGDEGKQGIQSAVQKKHHRFPN